MGYCVDIFAILIILRYFVLLAGLLSPMCHHCSYLVNTETQTWETSSNTFMQILPALTRPTFLSLWSTQCALSGCRYELSSQLAESVPPAQLRKLSWQDMASRGNKQTSIDNINTEYSQEVSGWGIFYFIPNTDNCSWYARFSFMGGSRRCLSRSSNNRFVVVPVEKFDLHFTHLSMPLGKSVWSSGQPGTNLIFWSGCT